jgi:arylsulfatase A-like enzyme
MPSLYHKINGRLHFLQSALLALCLWHTTYAADRPNIIFVLCDDLGYGDTGAFFQKMRQTAANSSEPWMMTPQLDTMATEGLQLRSHYCPAPVCAPSRASLLLGTHQGHANVRDNQFDKALADNYTLATVLKDAGYATACVGKWGLQGSGGTPAAWPAYPTKRGFDYYFGYVTHGDGHEHYPKEGLYSGAKKVYDGDTEVSVQLDKCYTTDLFTARSKKWIADHQTANPTQPFFLYLALDTPHAVLELPTQAYPAGGGLTGGLQWTGTSGAMINTASGTIDSFYHPDYAAATWDHDNISTTAEQAWPDVYRRYATCVRRIDDAMGDLVKTLKDLSIDSNTLIVFTTDNGPSKESYLTEKYDPNFFNSFGPFDGIKRDVWEGGIRVGATVRWPAGAPANRVSNLPCQFHDWMPTFAELAGTPVPAVSDGTSLVPTLKNTGVQKPPQVYVEYFEGGTTPNYPEFLAAHRSRRRNQMQAIRVGDFVGVRYNIASATDDFEVYNIISDPQQATNLASSRASLQQQMKDTVLRLRRPNTSAPRPYDAALIPPIATAAVTGGIAWKEYSHTNDYLPDLLLSTPIATGTSTRPDLAVLSRRDDVAALITGYLQVPSDGTYTFYLNSDTRAYLRIHEASVIDADFGYVGGTERSASIDLKSGRHPFRLYYARRTAGTPALSLQWQGPNFTRQAIPDGVYLRDGTGGGNIPPTAVDDKVKTTRNTPIAISPLANLTLALIRSQSPMIF